MSITRDRDVLAALKNDEGKVARGFGAVELLDDRGKRVLERVEFENFVAIPGQRVARAMARRAFQQGYTGQNSGGTPLLWGFSSVEGVYDERYDLPSIFHALYCTNDTYAEDPATEVYVPTGPVIAWAGKSTNPSSNSDVPFRGLPNMSESRLSKARMKMVFDWTTAEGNGTFQTIFWTATGNRLGAGAPVGTYSVAVSDRPLLGHDDLVTMPSWPANGGGLYYGGGFTGVGNHAIDPSDHTKMWLDGGDATAARIRQMDLLTGLIASGAPVITPASGNETLIGCDATYVYTRTSSSNLVKRYRKSDGGLQNSYTPAPPGGFGTLYDMAVDPVTGQLLVAHSNGVANGLAGRTYAASAYDAATGAFLRVLKPPTDESGNLGCGRGHVLYNGYLCAIPTAGAGPVDLVAKVSTGTSAKKTILPESALPAGTPLTEFEFTGGGSTSASPTTIQRCSTLAARTLLAAPVTKTNAQTMKITYQFDFV